MSGALFTSLFVLVLCVLILGLARAWGRYLACPPSSGGEAEQKALDLLNSGCRRSNLPDTRARGTSMWWAATAGSTIAFATVVK